MSHTLNTPFPKCYCGVSLSDANANFQGDRMKAVVDWIAAHSNQCLFVIGDDLHRWNLVTWEGTLSDKAIDKARIEGQKRCDALLPLLEGYPEEKFQIARWRELTKRQAFREWQEIVTSIISSSEDFGESLDSSARNYIDRLMNRGRRLRTSFEEALWLSKQYILEEIAVFGQLCDTGWIVDVYPGRELPILVKMAKSESYMIPDSFRKRLSIELEIIQSPSKHQA